MLFLLVGVFTFICVRWSRKHPTKYRDVAGHWCGSHDSLHAAPVFSDVCCVLWKCFWGVLWCCLGWWSLVASGSVWSWMLGVVGCVSFHSSLAQSVLNHVAVFWVFEAKINGVLVRERSVSTLFFHHLLHYFLNSNSIFHPSALL